MSTAPFLLRLCAFLVFVAMASAPFGDAVALARGAPTAENVHVSGMTGMDMAGEDDAMSCCPDAVPEPTMDCEKPACPALASCMQQCIPSSFSPYADFVDHPARDDVGPPRRGSLVASLAPTPPARPPRT